LLKNFNSKSSQESIDSAYPIRNDLWMVKNFFDPELLQDILNQIEIQTEWRIQEMQELLPRRTLHRTPDGLIDNIWSMLNDLDFSKLGLKFKHVTIWKDSAGYIIPEHEDNDQVKAAMQIYLNDIPQHLGTWFEEIEVPFIKNTGYIMKNTNKPRHGMRKVVPAHTTRYSLYAWFDLIESHA